MNKLFVCLFVIVAFTPFAVAAHQPVIEPVVPSGFIQSSLEQSAVAIEDPTKHSQAVYGAFLKPGEYDIYTFTAKQDAAIPIEVLVDTLPGNKLLMPRLVLIAKQLPSPAVVKLPFELPAGYVTQEIVWQTSSKKFYEPFSAERYNSGLKVELTVRQGENYFIFVEDTNRQIGKYVLGVGVNEDFSNTNFMGLFKNMALLKLGLVGGWSVPWLNILGLFLFIAGFVVGLGAVTVIDVIGFLGRRSIYFTELAIKAHRVTKPLIWLGLLLVLIGAGITYRESWLSGTALFQAVLLIILVINGLFLSFYISPKLQQMELAGKASQLLPKTLQNKIFISFVISFIAWWSNLFLLVWYLLVL